MSTSTNIEEPLSIGILGAARIAKKNSRAISHPATSCKVVSIASRNAEKAEGLVSEIFSSKPIATPVVYGGESAYAALVRDESCEAVYIPLPTKLHYGYVISALQSEKHVMLEKPVASSADEYRQMLNQASRYGKFLMDGTMFVHHPRTNDFVKSVPNATRVHFNFTFDGGATFHSNDIRTKKDGDFMGCIGDLGWYCTRMGLLVFSRADGNNLHGLVTDVQVTRFELNDEGVPIDAECLVYFTESRILSFHCSFQHPLNQTVHISGHGCGHTSIITDAILPFAGDSLMYTKVKQNLSRFDEIVTNETEVIECDNTLAQEVCMWRNFNRWTRTIEKESTPNSSASIADGCWWSGDSNDIKEANSIAFYSLLTQIVLDGLMESIKCKGSRVKIML